MSKPFRHWDDWQVGDWAVCVSPTPWASVGDIRKVTAILYGPDGQLLIRFGSSAAAVESSNYRRLCTAEEAMSFPKGCIWKCSHNPLAITECDSHNKAPSNRGAHYHYLLLDSPRPEREAQMVHEIAAKMEEDLRKIKDMADRWYRGE